MTGVLQGEFGDLDIKYLKQNISKSRSKISGSFRRNSVALCKMETWSSVLLGFAFLLWAEMDPANHKCLMSQAIRGFWIVGRGYSPGKRYQRIRICLTGEVETPCSPIRRQVLNVKYPVRGSGHVWSDRRKFSDVRYPEKVDCRSDIILPRVEWAMLRVTRGTVSACKV